MHKRAIQPGPGAPAPPPRQRGACAPGLYAGAMDDKPIIECDTPGEAGRALAQGHIADCAPAVAEDCGAPCPGEPQDIELEDVLESDPPPGHWA